MELFAARGHLVDQDGTGQDGFLSPLRVAVEREDQRGVAGKGQEFEAGDAGGPVQLPIGDGRAAAEFHVAGHDQPQSAGAAAGKANRKHLLRGRGLQRRGHFQRQLVPPDPFDEKTKPPGRVAPQRGVAAVELRLQQPDPGQVHRHGLQPFVEHVDGQLAGQADALGIAYARVVGRGDDNRNRRVFDWGDLGLAHQIVVFLPREEHAPRLVFQQHIEVLEGDEDLANFLRRLLGGHGRNAGQRRGDEQDQRKKST